MDGLWCRPDPLRSLTEIDFGERKLGIDQRPCASVDDDRGVPIESAHQHVKSPRGLHAALAMKLQWPGLQRSISDTPHGSSHLLVAAAMAIEDLPAFAEVVEPGAGRIAG